MPTAAPDPSGGGPSVPTLGCLYVVATPIGTLADLSPRAASVLGEADIVACEDSRVTRRLFSHLGLAFPRHVVTNDHTEPDAARRIASEVLSGKSVVLVSDAGAPAISDPGYLVVEAVAAAGGRIEIVPGPSSVIAALMASGLACHRFCFEGFLPRKGRARADRLDELSQEMRCVVIFESPKRITRTLQDLANACGGRAVAVCRELSKMHEEVVRGTIEDVAKQTIMERGEFVIVIGERTPDAPATDDDVQSLLAARHAAGVSLSQAAKDVATASGIARRAVYEVAIKSQLWD